MIKNFLPIIALFSSVNYANDFHRSHESHVHGHATLNMVLEDNRLILELNTPAINVLGFEHAPRTLSQKNTLASAIKILENPDNIVRLHDGKCTGTHVKISAPLFEQDEHSDFHVHYVFTCKAIEDLHEIDVNIFDSFPGLHTLHTQWILASGQGSKELDSSHRKVKIE